MKTLSMTILAVTIFCLGTSGSVFAQDNNQEDSESVSSEHEHHKGRFFKSRQGVHHKKMGKVMMEKIDANEDGKVDLNEYLTHTEQRFAKMDINGDGYVTPGEMREAHKLMRDNHHEAMKAARGAYKESKQEAE